MAMARPSVLNASRHLDIVNSDDEDAIDSTNSLVPTQLTRISEE